MKPLFEKRHFDWMAHQIGAVNITESAFETLLGHWNERLSMNPGYRKSGFVEAARAARRARLPNSSAEAAE